MPMRRTNIYLDDEQIARLTMLAGRQGVAMAALVREAIEEYLGKRAPEPLGVDEWKRRFDELLARRRTAAAQAGWAADAVDRDVAAAVSAVRKRRRAGRVARRP